MKKIIVSILAGLMLLGLAATALADDLTLPTDPTPTIQADNNTEVQAAAQYSIKNLQGYSEWVKLVGEAKTIMQTIKSNNQKIAVAIKTARQNKQDITSIVKDYRAKHKQLMADYKTLCTTQNANWKAMKTARLGKDQAKMQIIMNDILSVRQQKNAKLTAIQDAQQAVLQAIAAAPAKAPKTTAAKTPKGHTRALRTQGSAPAASPAPTN